MRSSAVLVASILLLVSLPLMAKVDFVREVKPILEIRCVRCHGAEVAMKHLRLNTKDRAMMVIVAKRPEESGLFLAARSGAMPPGGPMLPAAELETLRKWIAEGARWPKNVELVARGPFSAR
jgi:mono/diheme cytochrome c family protein